MNERLTDEQLVEFEIDSRTVFLPIIVYEKRIKHLISDLRHYKKLADEQGKQIERCLIGGNSLASVMIGLNLPEEWHDWTHNQASEYFYGHYVDGQAFEYYETWLCWKALHDVGKEQQP